MMGRSTIGMENMPSREEIRDLILGAAEGATGGVEALAAAGVAATVEDFDVEVAFSSGDRPALTATVRFSLVSALREARERPAA
jgi:hypothetical protein